MSGCSKIYFDIFVGAVALTLNEDLQGVRWEGGGGGGGGSQAI